MGDVMRLALVRHGQTDWNIQRRYQGWEGLDLNEAGRAQAVDAADRLREVATALGVRWDWLASSTSPRAVHTARIIGEHIGLEPGDRSDDLIERGFGVVEGMLIEEARTQWPTREYPGAEPVDTVLSRALRGITALAEAHQGQDGVVVTHGTTLRLVVGHVSGEDPGSLPNGAVAVLEGGPDVWQIAVHPLDTVQSERGQ